MAARTGRAVAVSDARRAPLERVRRRRAARHGDDVPRRAARPTPDGINRLNVYPVPDGDTGTNMARTLDAVVAEMEAAPGELGADVRRDQPRLADGGPGQQRRDPLADPARHRRRRSRAPPSATGGHRRRRARGGVDRRLPGGAHAGRGHDPHRRARERRRRRARRPTTAASLAGVLRAARDAGRAALGRTPELLPGAEGRRRRRRRRRRLPAAARRRAARRRRRAAARGRPRGRTPSATVGGRAPTPSAPTTASASSATR